MVDQTLRLWINGEAVDVEAPSTLGSWLAALDRDPRTVAVELNGAIVPRGDYDHTHLAAGDRLEVVHFVQGG
jgi:sulfur carrier protein